MHIFIYLFFADFDPLVYSIKISDHRRIMATDAKNGSESSNADKENILQLTDEQKNFIAECEKLFVTRYTEEDPDYKSILESSIGDPPIVDPWYSKPKRNYNWSGRRDDRRRGDSSRNDHRDDGRDRHRNFDDNRRDRYRHDRRDGYHNRGEDRYRNRNQNYRDRRHY